MHKLRSVMMTAAAAAGLAAAGSAKAAISYQYTTYTGATPVTTYNATVGVPITIPIYLYEKLTSGSSSLITSDGGLDGAGFSVTQSSGTGILTSIAGSTTTNGSNFSGGSSNPNGKNSSTFMGFGEAIAVSDDTGPVPNASGDVQIGSITITPTQATSTTFVLDSFNYSGPSTKAAGVTITVDTPYDLDGNSTSPAFTGAIANPETFIVAVPEPASASLLGIGALGLLARRRRTSAAI